MRSRLLPHYRSPSGARAGSWCLAALLALLAGALLAPAALAAGNPTGASKGTIDGNLVDGTTGGTPLAGQTITLMEQVGAGERQIATTVTDAQGMFHFAGLATDTAAIYAATVQYQGAPYTTDPLSLADNPNARVTLLAYEATSSDARIGIARVVVQLQQHPADVQAGMISVAELVTVVNGGQRTYVGTPGPADGKPMNLLRFALPTGATNIVTGDGFGQGQILQVDRGFATTAPVLPGQTGFSFTYTYPYGGTRALFTYQAIYPTLQLIVLAPSDVTINAPTLASQGMVSAQGAQVQVWQGSNLPAGRAASLVIAKLPVPGEQSDLDLALLYWLAGALAALGAGLVGYHLVRTRQHSEVASKVASGAGPNSGIAPYASQHPPESSARAGATSEDLLRALAKLDRAREAGKVADDRYRERRDAIKSELRARLLAQAGVPSAGDGR